MPRAATLALTVQFGDCDPAQIVFYPNFFRWFDAATWHLFASAGLTLESMRTEHGMRGIPLVDARSRFIEACWPGDRIEIDSAVKAIGRSSFRLTHRVRRGETPIAEGEEVRVWAVAHPERVGALAAAPLPAAVRARLEDGEAY